MLSDELLADHDTTALSRWFAASDDERRALAQAAAQRRTDERSATPEVTLTLDSLLAKLGFSHDYAEHLVQPYCTCGDSADGWSPCAHARDLGLDT